MEVCTDNNYYFYIEIVFPIFYMTLPIQIRNQ